MMKSREECRKDTKQIVDYLKESIDNWFLKKSEKYQMLQEVESLSKDVQVLLISQLVGLCEVFAQGVDSCPYFQTKVSFYEEQGVLTTLIITFKGKFFEYKNVVKGIRLDNNILAHILGAFENVIEDMVEQRGISENLNNINSFLHFIGKSIESTYSVQLCFTGNATKKIEQISDKILVINVVDKDLLFDMKAFELFNGQEDNFTRGIVQRQIKEIKDAFLNSFTPVQFLKSDCWLVNKFVGLTNRNRVDKLLRLTYKRKAQNLGVVKNFDCIGYWEGEYDGDKVFALVEKKKDNTLTVVLSPFCIHTNVNIDVDVLSIVEKELRG